MSSIQMMSKPSPTSRHPVSGTAPDAATGLHFRVKLGSISIGLFTECSGLGVEYEVLSWEEGGLNDFVRKLRGRAKHPNLILKRGVTRDGALMKWFFDCRDRTSREDITLELISPDGKTLRAWAFTSAFPVKWTGPTFNAGQNSVATETLEIVHEGFAPAR